MNPGVVDEDLDRAISEHAVEGCAGGGSVRDIKGERLCLAAFGDDFGYQGADGIYSAMRLRVDKMAIACQATADRGADLTTAAGDECASRDRRRHEAVRMLARARVASSKTVARPLR